MAVHGFYLSVYAAPHSFQRERHQNVEIATKVALNVIKSPSIARGNDFGIHVHSKKEIIEGERLEFKWNKRMITEYSRVGFILLVKSMGTQALYQNVIRSEIIGLRDTSLEEYYSFEKDFVQRIEHLY